MIVSILSASGLGSASSATLSADVDTYTIAPGDTVKIAISDISAVNGTSSFKSIVFTDADNFSAAADLKATVTIDDHNASIRLKQTRPRRSASIR